MKQMLDKRHVNLI